MNWSVKAEYLYVDILDTSSGVGRAIVASQLRENVARLGINYKLGGL